MAYTQSYTQACAERMHAQAAEFKMEAAELERDANPLTQDESARFARYLRMVAAQLEMAIADPAIFPRTLEAFQAHHAELSAQVRGGAERERMRVCEQACRSMGYAI